MTTLNDTTDAMVWAEEFCRIFNGHILRENAWADLEGEVTVGTMVTWFANAIETGRNAGRRETCPHTDVFDISEDMTCCRTCGMLNPGG